jgi:predicted NACHT family NTPase
VRSRGATASADENILQDQVQALLRQLRQQMDEQVTDLIESGTGFMDRSDFVDWV